jgi:hypothetical protein
MRQQRKYASEKERHRANYLRQREVRRHVAVSGDLYRRIGAAADAALVPMVRLADALVTAALDAAEADKR